MRETLGHYKILDRIGAGGIGELYRARDTRHGRTVALRIVRPDVLADPDRRARLLHNATVSEALSHPNIAALYEAGEDQGQLFIASEYVPGQTLRATIGGRPLNARRAIAFASQVADALADAHAAGVFHSDIKPDNVMVTPKGNTKILDMGLSVWTAGGAARARAGRATIAAAMQDQVVGRTAPYISPEQALGEAVDHRTDIFSLGAVLFEMLTGREPFKASTAAELTQEIVYGPLAAPSSLVKSLPAEIDPIVEQMLAKRPADRYESAATVAAELRSVLAILDRRDAASEAPIIVPGADPRSGAAGWLIVVAILAAVAALVWFASRA
jgi:serine/threonine protein kinase